MSRMVPVYPQWGLRSFFEGQPDEKRYMWSQAYLIEGTHEAIIEAEVFETVQKQIANRRRECKNKRTQILLAF